MQQLTRQPDVRIDALERLFRFANPFGDEPFVLMIVACDRTVTQEERNALCDAIVGSGCGYACCAGHQCEIWHDTIDESFIATDPDFDPPEERFIMTTWHTDEPVSEVVWFTLDCTDFEDLEFSHYLILLIGNDREQREQVIQAVQDHFGSTSWR